MKSNPSLSTASLRIEFFEQADRWAHRISVLNASGGSKPVAEMLELVVLESVEGTDQEDWPSSPATQEVHLEGACAFLVGATTAAHFSASIEADSANDCLIFDIACRVRQAPKHLGSTYRLLAENNSSAGVQAKVQIDPLPGSDSTPSCQLQQVENSLSLTTQALEDRYPCTQRWRYKISVAAT